MLVGVVRVGAVEIRAVDDSAITAVQHGRINCGGVAIQLHADPQAVQEDRRDHGALLGKLSLLLHQGRQRHHVMRAGGGSQTAPNFSKAGHHEAAELLWGGVAAQFVGVRKQVALQAGRLRVEVVDQRRIGRRLHKPGGREQTGLFGGGSDVEDVLALGNQ